MEIYGKIGDRDENKLRMHAVTNQQKTTKILKTE